MSVLWISIRVGGILAALGLLVAVLTGAFGGFVGAAYVMFGGIAFCALLAFALVSVSSFGSSALVIGLNGFVILACVVIVAGQIVADRTVRDVVGVTSSTVYALKTASSQLSESWFEPARISDTDLRPIILLLDELRFLPLGYQHSIDVLESGGKKRTRLGLVDHVNLRQASHTAYREALSKQLLPRLLLRLEQQMQTNLNNKDFLYESLKIYLMLGQQGPMNADLIKEWFQTDWALAYPGPADGRLRDALALHLDGMLDRSMDAIDLNGPLVQLTQELLSETSLAQRGYNSIISSTRARDLPEWRLTDIGGPAVSRVFVRSSGKPLNEGIEGIFTREGFNTVFLDEALDVAQHLNADSWVLGERGIPEQSETALVALSRDVLDLYYADYIARYDQILDDINIIPTESLSHAVEVTNILSGPTSPLVNILAAISDQTRLSEQGNVGGDASAMAGKAMNLGALAEQSQLSSRAQLLLGTLRSSTTAGDAAPPPPGAFVEEHFSWLHDLTEEINGQPSQLSALISSLTEVFQELNKLSFAGGVNLGPPDVHSIARFQAQATRFPGPIQRWATQISSVASGTSADNTRASINARWQAQVLPFCEQASAYSYPFARDSRTDVPLDDFTRLFGPNGLIDSFFIENLANFVDTSARPWAWARVNDTDLGISPAVLQQFEYAADIRNAFFAGGAAPAVRFTITPEALDPKASQVVLDINGTEVKYAHSAAPKPAVITWPGSVGSARIVFEPLVDGTSNAMTRDGPWAWFRLLDAAEVRRTNEPDRTRVIFNVGGRIALFQMQSGSVLNPFALPALSKFSCPKSF